MEEHPVPSEVVQSFLKNLQKLEEGYPLQYILGEWEFYGHTFMWRRAFSFQDQKRNFW
ncbi:MAG: hypothetical protein RMK75_00535 [Aquificaceae bacterium]|nr:hypothetical protein [Aquificaceae bacterium]MDW8422799.1 hypothetical protein [Aquificaceae bacterium]